MSGDLILAVATILVALLGQTLLAARWAGKWQERLERVSTDVGDLRKWKHREVTGFMSSTNLRLGLLEQKEGKP